MSLSFEWHGVFPALTTPFTPRDEVDLEMFAKSINAQVDAGVHGIILGGTLGEASTLTTDEKEKLVKFAGGANKKTNSYHSQYRRRCNPCCY
jgi:4-hydroxy-tetrahydrodipicolinate synthase